MLRSARDKNALLHILDAVRSAAEGLLRERGLHEQVEVAVEHGAVT